MPVASPAPQTPVPTTVAGVPATIVHLGEDSAPIDVTVAFGSVWVASHHGNEVIRIDPVTLEEIARIKVGNGPGWFAVTDDAVWVTLQMSRGMSRIDPTTNTSVDRIGMWAPCFAPVVAFGSIWQGGCDAHQVTRIDPVTLATTDITVGEQAHLVLAGDQILTAGPLGLSRIDPKTNTIETIGGPVGHVAGFAGGTIWITDDTRTVRVDPKSGEVVATLALPFGGLVTEQDGYAWLVEDAVAVRKIDLATNEILQTLAIREALVAREAEGALWVTAYGYDSLLRIEP